MIQRPIKCESSEDFALYPDLSQTSTYSPPPTTTVDMMSTGPYPFASAIGFDPSWPVEPHQNYIFGGNSSPGLSYEDQVPSSNLSTASAPSPTSSAVGSPQSHHGQLAAPALQWTTTAGLTVMPNIVDQGDCFPGSEYSYSNTNMADYSYDLMGPKAGFVDPSLIHPEINGAPLGIPQYGAGFQVPNPPFSPPLSVSASPQPVFNNSRSGSHSPYLPNPSNFYSPFQPPLDPSQQRRPSEPYNNFSGDESKEKQRCPHQDCGKVFKDLKAHMLTHQTERPEKCPIQSCDYHVKGFSRKYDRNRHTLTHYKGTMVCGFCPGSGSAAEKSFNRADVFKRHLTAVHGVEQTPPNSRKKTSSSINSGKKLTGYAPDATGKCSTCSQTFSNAQDFYEHLDDCVLRIVQQEDPAEAINAKRLAEVEDDKDVHNTLEKNQLPVTTQTVSMDDDADDDEIMTNADDEDEDSKRSSFPKSGTAVPSASSPTKKKINPANGVQKSRGMTHSRGGVPLPAKSRGRKNRREYPSSWGFDKGQMTMKKRVIAVFDGPRRLAKDDMMLSTDHEVRVPLSDGKSYVTDLDVQTLKRVAGFHGATEEEKGPWISDDPTEEQMNEMMKLQQQAE